MSLLEVRDLSVTFGGWRGAPPVEAVKRISFVLDRGETVALVGESGSGKSVTALSVLQLLPYPAASHTPESSIRFDSEELVGEVLFIHKGLSGSAARARTLELLHLVGLRDAEKRLQAYPHQLSGGQRQRVMIAM